MHDTGVGLEEPEIVDDVTDGIVCSGELPTAPDDFPEPYS